MALGISGVLMQAPPSTTEADQKPGSIARVVRDGAGSPIERASVRAFEDGRPATATTDAQGRYELRLPPGKYVVVAGREYSTVTERKTVTLGPDRSACHLHGFSPGQTRLDLRTSS